MQLDVKGVLTNKVLHPELVLAVQVVAQGGMHANNWMLDQLKHKRKRSTVAEQRDAVRLTERESEVAQCILAHPALSYLGTGNLLGIGERTVETHVRSLLKKYHQPNRLSWLAFMMPRSSSQLFQREEYRSDFLRAMGVKIVLNSSSLHHRPFHTQHSVQMR
ncbi:MAG: response regulator transcription factor [Flavobacteriales bacterium]|nr:response regulator transcription factor [Flavobacteriales bacterium]